MANTREKLIELLEQSLIYDGTGREMRFTGGDVTPCLIANGVTPIPQTNADRIRAMSDEELAWELIEYNDDRGEYYTHNGCRLTQKEALEAEIEWLKQPAEECQ